MNIRIGIEQVGQNRFRAVTGHPKFYKILFYFERCNVIGPQWKFWPSENTVQPVTFDGEQFPEEYFYNLCRAKFFVEMGIDEYPEQVILAKGQKFLGKTK